MRTRLVLACSFLLSTLPLALLGVGCGGSDDPCIQACESANDCGADTDCEAECASYDRITGCAGAFDDLFACYNDHDVCSLTILEECNEEISATITCQVEFCNDNPEDAACQGDG